MIRIHRRSRFSLMGSRKFLASELAQLRTAAASENETLRMLFDMVTTDGPVPSIDAGESNGREEDRAS